MRECVTYFFEKNESLAKKKNKDEEKNKIKQEVQVLQAFAFSVVTVNDEHRKPGFKIKCRV